MPVFQFRLIPLVVIALTMMAFAEGVFDFLPEPPPEASPRAAIEQANRLMADGQVAAAMFNLRRAANAIGETAEVLVYVARCQIQIDELDQAQGTLCRAIRTRLDELGVDARSAANTAVAEQAANSVGIAPDALPANLMGRENGDAAFRRPTASNTVSSNEPLIVPRDTLLSEAWTRLAQIELRRASNLSASGLTQTNSVLQAVISNGEPVDLQAARCRDAARRYAQQALLIRPDNRTARELTEQLNAARR